MWVGALIEDINRKLVLIVPEGKEEEAKEAKEICNYSKRNDSGNPYAYNRRNLYDADVCSYRCLL